jgi:hypothetical protein
MQSESNVSTHGLHSLLKQTLWEEMLVPAHKHIQDLVPC